MTNPLQPFEHVKLTSILYHSYLSSDFLAEERRKARGSGMPLRVACFDIFNSNVSIILRASVMRCIAQTPDIKWIMTTEDYELASRCLTLTEMPNLWLGCVVKNKAELVAKVPAFMCIPVAHRFLDLKGLEETMNVQSLLGNHGFEWLVLSGDKKPMHPIWVSYLQEQAAKAGAAFFFKGWGTWIPQAGTTWDNWVTPDGEHYKGSFDTRQELMARLGEDSCGIEQAAEVEYKYAHDIGGRPQTEFPKAMTRPFLSETQVVFCDKGHRFAAFDDHLKQAGVLVCPYCMDHALSKILSGSVQESVQLYPYNQQRPYA